MAKTKRIAMVDGKAIQETIPPVFLYRIDFVGEDGALKAKLVCVTVSLVTENKWHLSSDDDPDLPYIPLVNGRPCSLEGFGYSLSPVEAIENAFEGVQKRLDYARAEYRALHDLHDQTYPDHREAIREAAKGEI